MKVRNMPAVLAAAGVLSLTGGQAIPADKYEAKVPDGLALSEVKGYESWEVVSVSHPEGSGDGMGAGELLNVIVANAAMIQAYASGIPGNGKPFPDGAKAVKIQFTPVKSPDAPASTQIPGGLKSVAVMVKDSRRFAASGGWGYGMFAHDAATGEFKPTGTGSACGVACHTIAKAKDFVFTKYEKR